MRQLPLLLSLVLAACAAARTSEAPQPKSSDEQKLLELHQAGLNAHIEGNIDALLINQADDFVLLNRGEISSPSKQQRREFLGPHLAATKFEFYRDAVTPIVKVSRDGSLGWVAAQVEARGNSVTPAGEHESVEFVVAWIELYERRGREWVSIGNASSFKAD
jgi:hypothetical protein